MGGVGGGDLGGREQVEDFGWSQESREGECRSDAFAEADHVGSHAVMFVGEPFAGATEAGLDFVEDQQHVIVIGPFAECLHVLHRQR